MGIQALQSGSKVEGARLIRIALKRNLPPEIRAIAYLWLAESTDDPQLKRAHYTEASALDPNNTEARTRLAALMNAQFSTQTTGYTQPVTTYTQPVTTYTAPVTPPPTGQLNPQAVPPQAPQAAVNIADVLGHVIGGVNGAGTAFFITPDGLMVTSRYVVGALERLMVELHNGRQLPAQVVASYPDIDLAILYVEHRPPAVLPISPLSRVPDDAPLYVVTYDGEMFQAQQRPTKRIMPAHWIPTNASRIPDAGGNPIFDERNYLVGMMTRNVSRASNHLFGVHISAIRRYVETYMQLSREARRYCPNCGTLSRAFGAGFFYCEVCGGTRPETASVQRYYLPQADILYETGRQQCVHCKSIAGVYKGRCLRCGKAQQ